MANKELQGYVKESLSQGKGKDEIYKELLAHGWGVDDIHAVFEEDELHVEDEVDTHKKTVRIILSTAVTLIGAGIFSFIAANWQIMSRPAKVSVILISMIVVYAAGWYAKYKTQFPRTGEALILLGSIIYGSGIFLVGQMFNIRASWPDGFILWMLGVIAMAYASDSFLLYYIAVPLGAIAIFGHPFIIFAQFGYGRFVLTSSIMLIIATAATFAAGYAIRKKMPQEPESNY